MISSHSSRPGSSLDRLAPLAAAVSIAVGVAVLCGWAFDKASLKGILPGSVAMNPLTAVAFVFAGASLSGLRVRGRQPSLTLISYILAGLVLAIGMAKLGDVFLGLHFDLDQLLFRDRLGAVGSQPHNRMAPNSALSFMLVGAALLTSRLDKQRFPASQCLALLPAGLSLLALFGYLLRVQELYGVASHIPMALSTAITFLALSLGILFDSPSRGITRVFVADDPGGAMARGIIPCALLVPPLLALLRLHAERAGTLGTDLSVSAMVFVSSALLTGFIWFNATRLSRAAEERQAALDDLKRAHDGLEGRVRERTDELEQTNAILREEVAKRARTETALRESEARYRLLFLSNPHPMWVYDRESLRFLAVNDAAQDLYGYSAEEFRAMTIRDIRPPGDATDTLMAAAIQDRPDLKTAREFQHQRRNGSLVNVAVASHTLEFDGRSAVLVLAHDVTGHKQVEAQLRQSQKMEAIGRLAGGVAHDFNNLLTAIMGYSQLLRRRLAPDDKAVRDLDEVMKAAERAAALTRQLLAFSRQQVMEPKVLDLNQVVTDMDKMLRRLIGEDIDLVCAPQPDLGRIKADPGQIEQVLMNLAVNARDAMPQGGMLTIETADVDLDESYVRTRTYVRPGKYIMLAVSDTGCGISPDLKARIFEPFFTTKEVGKGTGLGLSTVHGIVKQSEGYIEVYSELGQGTTFKVYLPRVEGSVDVAPAHSPEAQDCDGSEIILVVEDEHPIRNVMKASLELHGYTVLEAGDGSEAIALCEQSEQPIDLVVSDVVMPLMSGPELVQRIAVIRPGLRFLLVSGYTDRALLHQGRREATTAFLQKPFTPDTLARKVREVLDQPREMAA